MAMPAAMQTETKEEVRENGTHPLNAVTEDTHECMAQAVAKILRPTIMQAVDEAVHKSLQSFQKSLETQAQRITETESRISLIEDDFVDFQTHTTTTEATIKTLLATWKIAPGETIYALLAFLKAMALRTFCACAPKANRRPKAFTIIYLLREPIA